jgi:hypothetical protein
VTAAGAPPCGRVLIRLRVEDELVVADRFVADGELHDPVEDQASAVGAAPVEASFLRLITIGQFEVVDLSLAAFGRCAELVEAYASLRLGFVEASVVTVTENLRVVTFGNLEQPRLRRGTPPPHRGFRTAPLSATAAGSPRANRATARAGAVAGTKERGGHRSRQSALVNGGFSLDGRGGPSRAHVAGTVARGASR